MPFFRAAAEPTYVRSEAFVIETSKQLIGDWLFVPDASGPSLPSI